MLVFFFRYCTAATADLESHLRLDDSDFQNPRIKCFLSQWRLIVIFGALRTMLAPLVETVVLLDRFLFLSENNLPPILKPIFDARLSPRNFLLLSVKNSEQLTSWLYLYFCFSLYKGFKTKQFLLIKKVKNNLSQEYRHVYIPKWNRKYLSQSDVFFTVDHANIFKIIIQIRDKILLTFSYLRC